jgi:glutaredoxin
MQRFVVFTKDDCSWCQKTKDLLVSEGHDYFEWNIDQNLFAKEFIKQMGFITIPQTYFRGTCIGGHLALVNFLGIN